MNLKISPDRKPNPNPKPTCTGKPIRNPNLFPIHNPMPLTYDFSYDNLLPNNLLNKVEYIIKSHLGKFAVTSGLWSH